MIAPALHRTVHKWMGQRPWEPKDFVADLLRNERIHFQGSPSTRSRQEQRKQELSHRLNRGADRLESGQPQQFIATVRGHHAGTIALVAVGIRMELGVTDPVRALKAPAIAHELQQGFWGGAQARQKPLCGAKELTITGASRRLMGYSFGDDFVYERQAQTHRAAV